MANIKKRSETSYLLTVSCGYDIKGKKIRKFKTINLPEGMTKKQREKEVQRAAILFEQEVENGTFLEGRNITFEEFANMWFNDYAEKQLTPSTLRVYKTRLNRRIVPALGHMKLANIQPHHVLEFDNSVGNDGDIRLDTNYLPTELVMSKMCTRGVKLESEAMGIDAGIHNNIRKGKRVKLKTAKKVSEYFCLPLGQCFTQEKGSYKLSSKTIKHYHDLLSTILETAVEWGIIDRNPAKRIKAPRVKRGNKKRMYYDDKQVAQLLSCLAGEPIKYQTIIYLTIDTGMRLSEVAGLEWSDIDFQDNCITISKQRQQVSGYGTFVKEPKTESGNRQVTVSETVIKLLRQLKKEQSINRLKLGNAWFESDIAFTHDDGKPINPRRPYHWLQSFLEKNNLPQISFHALRHTNASLMIAEGIDIVTLSGRLGHSDKNVTLNVYSHMIKSKEKMAANKMEAFYGRLNNERTFASDAD